MSALDDLRNRIENLRLYNQSKWGKLDREREAAELFDNGNPTGAYNVLIKQGADCRAEIEKLRALMLEWVFEAGAPHHPSCPEDDTCDCSLVKRIESALENEG